MVKNRCEMYEKDKKVKVNKEERKKKMLKRLKKEKKKEKQVQKVRGLREEIKYHKKIGKEKVRKYKYTWQPLLVCLLSVG